VALSLPTPFPSDLVLFMLRSGFVSHAVALIGLILGPCLAVAETGAPMARVIDLAIEDFMYLDTSGEPVDQEAAHRIRLQAFNLALRQDFEADGQYHLVSVSCQPACMDDGSAPAALLRAASDAGAKILVIGAIHKLSTLVQNAKVVAIDVDAKRVVFNRLFTFRGDNDEAWRRAEAFMSEEVREALAKYCPPGGKSTQTGVCS
jgi:hypothetical protein